MRALEILPLCAFIILGAFAQSTCGNVQLQLTPDYSFAIGSSSGGSAYTFTLGGQTLASGPLTQLALFRFDTSLNSTSGIVPAQSKGTSFVPGKFGSAVTVLAGGTLSYPQSGNVSFADGTVEMWVSPQYDGSNSIYTGNTGTPQAQVLFHSYWGGSGGELILAIANHGGGPYFYVGASHSPCLDRSKGLIRLAEKSVTLTYARPQSQACQEYGLAVIRQLR